MSQSHFKKLEGEDEIYSVRIGLDYRALAIRNGDRVVGIGSALTPITNWCETALGCLDLVAVSGTPATAA
jgi:hypothetical protein